MVAGIIGAKGTSDTGTKGIYGVAPNAKIIPVKVFRHKGSAKFSVALRGFNHVYDQYSLVASVAKRTVINISWGTNSR
jgi:subtilisin family serine protease